MQMHHIQYISTIVRCVEENYKRGKVMELNERMNEVVEKSFDYHMELLQKCLKGEREPLTKFSRNLAIEVEMHELINECQEWKPWKKGKETNVEKVKEEIADVLLFTFDRVCITPICDIKDINLDMLNGIAHILQYKKKENTQDFERIFNEYVTEQDKIARIMKCYDITMEDLLDTIEMKIIKNQNREDHI